MKPLHSMLLPLAAIGLAAISPGGTAWAQSNAPGQPSWRRHTIDERLRGADGVRLGDLNRDGRPDLVTGWEESGHVRIYVNPGRSRLTAAWPAATIAQAGSPEDAIIADLDRDGRPDVLSCHEGRQRQVLVHWNNTPPVAVAGDDAAQVDPRERDGGEAAGRAVLTPEHWSTSPILPLDGQRWMYAAPLGPHGDRPLWVLGSKGPQASITLLVGPPMADVAREPSRRDWSRWDVHRLRDVGWIMSLAPVDMDGDGDLDVVFSDRKGRRRGVGWLEHPDQPAARWSEHAIAGQGREVMFLSASPSRCLVATRGGVTLDCRRVGQAWRVKELPNPTNVPLGKSVAALPDGSLLWTANTRASPHPRQPGFWRRDPQGRWRVLDPTSGVKYDRMELCDLDGDGDLDVLTCEERRQLGVVWYENPGGR